MLFCPSLVNPENWVQLDDHLQYALSATIEPYGPGVGESTALESLRFQVPSATH